MLIYLYFQARKIEAQRADKILNEYSKLIISQNKWLKDMLEKLESPNIDDDKIQVIVFKDFFYSMLIKSYH